MRTKDVKMFISIVAFALFLALIVGCGLIAKGQREGNWTMIGAAAGTIYFLLGVLVGIFSKAYWEYDLDFTSYQVKSALDEIMWPVYNDTSTFGSPPVKYLRYGAYVLLMGAFIGPKLVFNLVVWLALLPKKLGTR